MSEQQLVLIASGKLLSYCEVHIIAMEITSLFQELQTTSILLFVDCVLAHGCMLIHGFLVNKACAN